MDPYLGEIRLFPYTFAPVGWHDCDGSLQSIAENEVLYTLIGTTYGGDGQNTFALPDLRGRLPVHQGIGNGLSQRILGEIAGTETVTLNAQQIPAHSHGVLVSTQAATTGTPGSNVLPGALSGDAMYTADTTGLNPIAMSGSMLAPAGSGQPHDNIMPTLAVRFCICMAGIFPTQS